MDTRMKSQQQIFRKYKGVFFLETVGVMLAGVVGWYFFARRGNYGSAALTLLVGAVGGGLVGLLMRRRLPEGAFDRTGKRIDLILAALSFLLMAGGVWMFVSTREPVGLAGAIFFGFASVYLIWKHSGG